MSSNRCRAKRDGGNKYRAKRDGGRSCRRTVMVAVCAVFTAIGPALAQSAKSEPISKTPTATISAGLGGELSARTSAVITRWTPFITEASQRFGIAEDWIKAVMRMESGGHTTSANGTPITSKTGAMGLMQLMPDTWRDMQRQYGLGQNPYDPHDNVIAGAAYLRWLYEKFGFPKMFAAYNAGPATEAAHSAGFRGLPNETSNYVRGIAHILGSKAPDTEVDGATIPAVLRGKSIPTQRSTAVSAVLRRSVPESTMVSFTRPDGAQVDIDAATVTSIRVPIPDEYAPGVRTVLSMGLRRQGVLEDPDKVMALLKGHGARI